MPGRSVTATALGPVTLVACLVVAFLCLNPGSVAKGQEGGRSLRPVAALPPLEVISGERVRDHAVIRTEGGRAVEPAPSGSPPSSKGASLRRWMPRRPAPTLQVRQAPPTRAARDRSRD